MQELGDIKMENNVIYLLQKPKSLTYATTQTGHVKHRPFSYVAFLNESGIFLIDTYMVVLMACQIICEGNYVVKEKRLVNELHEAIQDLYDA